MHCLLHPVGSHGDVHPLVGVGRALAARGHRVTLVTAAPFAPLAARHGFAFAPVGTAEDYDAVVTDPGLWKPTRSLRVIFRPDRFATALRQAHRALADRVVPGDTVILNTTLGFAARLVEETHGVPVVTAHLQPAVLPSVADPPARPLRWLPPAARRLAYRAADAFLLDPLFAPTLNRVRRELGLRPVRRVWGEWKTPSRRQLGLFPRWFADAPDWPANLRVTGFVRYDGGEAELPATVEQFLGSGPPPVVVSFGSAMRTGRRQFTAAVAGVHAAGRRGLVLAKGGEQIPPLPPGVAHADYAPFSRVFGRAAAVVHHGGIGTTAQALAAGLPQLVVPMSFDQPDNARRLRALGVARVVPARRFTPATAAAALRDLLGSDAVRAACEAARAKMTADPLDEVCRLVEQQRGTDRRP